MAYERSADVLVVMFVRNKVGLQEEEQCRAKLCEGKRPIEKRRPGGLESWRRVRFSKC